MFWHAAAGRSRSKSARRARAPRRRRLQRQLTAEPLENRELLATLVGLANIPADQGFVLNSVVPQDRTGLSVSSAGDVNRDGFDDLLIGAPVQRDFPAGTGQTYLVYGRGSSFGGSLNLWQLDGTNGFSLFGLQAEDHFGLANSSAGDVNGDGFHDVIIGAPFADRNTGGGPVPGTGQAYVFLGGSDGLPATSQLDGDNGFLVQGLNPFDRLGFSVDSAGDINGDGYDDVILGAPVDLNFAGGPGRSYIIYGTPDGFDATINAWMLAGADGFSLLGVDAFDHAGFAVSGIGDLNGDGFDDFAIGAPYADRPGSNGTLYSSGETYVVFGGFDQVPSLSQLDGTDGFLLRGFQAYDWSGFSLSSAGDVNGDGIDDLLIGAPASLELPVGAGKAYVVFGKDTPFDAAVNLWELDGSDGFIIQGIDGADHHGFSVSGAGDVNGDGFDDLILGAPGADRGLSYGVGEAYVVLGRASAFPARLFLSNLADNEGLLMPGVSAYDRTGYSVSSAGDVNGDGFDDLFIGAPVDTYYSFRAGRGYVVFGRDFTALQPTRGDNSDNTLAGDANANALIGGQGDDVLNGLGGADVLLGGQGDDVLAIADLAFRRLDGGRGHDVLRLAGAGLTLALDAIPDSRIRGIEEIDITGSGDNQLLLGNVREVLNLSDTSNRLVIRRDAGDTVDIGTGWTEDQPQVIGDDQFRVFRQGAAELLVSNLPPEVDLNGPDGAGVDFQATYTEDAAAVSIVDVDLSVEDDDRIVSATATITNLLDASHESLAVNTDGTAIQAGYNAATGVLALSGSAPASAYAAVLRTLSYRNASQKPNTTDRVIDVAVHDGLVSSNVASSVVSVVAVNDAPVLNTAPLPALSAVPEDTVDPAGDTVAAIVVDGSVTDPDGTAVEAIAVVGVNGTNGTWQFSTGGDWMDFAAPTIAAARLLGPADRIRFVPNPNFHGSATLTFKAWDQTSGTAGETADTTGSGGVTAFSSLSDTARVNVTPVNDAPQLDTAPSPRLTTIKMNERDSAGDLISAIVANGSITDIDGQVLKAIAVIAVDETNGHWEHSADGQNWSTISASAANALLLGPSCRIRFVPDLGFTGTASLTFRAWDRSSGFEGGTADTTQNGGTTPFSAASDTAEILVREIDASPTLDRIPSPRILPPGTASDTVDLTGISDGGTGTETLTVTAISDNPAVLPDPQVGYASPGETATLTLQPVGAASGWAIVTVTVSEGDGDSFFHSFAVSVGVNPRVWQNPFDGRDVSGDTVPAPGDVLMIINELNSPQIIDATGRLPNPPPPGMPPPFYDVTGDGFLAPLDALLVINFLNDLAAQGEGEGGLGEPELAGPRIATPILAPRAPRFALLASPAAQDDGSGAGAAEAPRRGPLVEPDQRAELHQIFAAHARADASEPSRVRQQLDALLDDFDPKFWDAWWR